MFLSRAARRNISHLLSIPREIFTIRVTFLSSQWWREYLHCHFIKNSILLPILCKGIKAKRYFASSFSQSSYQKTCRESAKWIWSTCHARSSAEVFGSRRSLSLIYSQVKTGSWVFNNSLATAAYIYKVCSFPTWQKVTEVTCSVCKLSCKQNILLLFLLLQPEDLVPCWWKPGDSFLVICL